MTPEQIDLARLPRVTVPGASLAYLEQGEGPLVLCLHGFPDNACTWLSLMDTLARAGYRVIAPFMRGYYPSSVAADGDYSAQALAGDVLALIAHFGQPDASGRQQAIVIGHDWGGLAALTAANTQPDAISKLVVSGIPHLHKAPFTIAQLFRSWYVLFFQLPLLPEWAVARNRFRFIDHLYHSWSPLWTANTVHLDSVKASLSGPGALPAALGYYRAMVRRMSAERWAVVSRKTTVPALVFTGLMDGSTGAELFRHSDECYEHLHALVKLASAGHFPHLEEPEQVAHRILGFLGRPA